MRAGREPDVGVQAVLEKKGQQVADEFKGCAEKIAGLDKREKTETKRIWAETAASSQKILLRD